MKWKKLMNQIPKKQEPDFYDDDAFAPQVSTAARAGCAALLLLCIALWGGLILTVRYLTTH